jgi:hypothetical protein
MTAQPEADAGCYKPRYSRRQCMGTGIPEDENDGDEGPHSAQKVGSLVDKR